MLIVTLLQILFKHAGGIGHLVSAPTQYQYLSLSLGQNYLGYIRKVEFSQKCIWWESGFLLHLEHTPIIFTHFQSFWWISPVGKNSKPISVQMQIILTNYSINTPQIAILFEVNCSYLSNKETEKQKLCPCEESGLSLNPEIFLVLVNTTVLPPS